jgi:hypothetical protein
MIQTNSKSLRKRKNSEDSPPHGRVQQRTLSSCRWQHQIVAILYDDAVCAGFVRGVPKDGSCLVPFYTEVSPRKYLTETNKFMTSVKHAVRVNKEPMVGIKNVSI